MSEDEAIERAVQFAQANNLKSQVVCDARYLSVDLLDKLADQCPEDIIETYKSVRAKFRNHWVVTSEKRTDVECVESTDFISIFDDGEVILNG